MDTKATTPTGPSEMYGLSTGRLEALSDGVLAIVITLLVLGFETDEKAIGELAEAHPSKVLSYLASLWPQLLGYVLSFLLIGIYWILHHVMFHHIRRASRGLLWLNMLFLMSVAFLPFPTELLAECIFHESSVIVALYGATHLVTGLSLAGVWLYATHGGRLVEAETSLAIGIYALVPVIYLIPGRLDEVWLHRGAARRHPLAWFRTAQQT